MHTNLKPMLLACTALSLTLCAVQPASAVPLLGTDLAAFTVLGARMVTNVGPSSIAGNVEQAFFAGRGNHARTAGHGRADTHTRRLHRDRRPHQSIRHPDPRWAGKHQCR